MHGDRQLLPDPTVPRLLVLRPVGSGVYAGYFSAAPLGVPVDGWHRVDGTVLLYVGISPKRPPENGGHASKQTLRKRVRDHYRGNASGSTLRPTLGVLLADELGIGLRRVRQHRQPPHFQSRRSSPERVDGGARPCVPGPRPAAVAARGTAHRRRRPAAQPGQNAHGGLPRPAERRSCPSTLLARSLPILAR